MKISEVIKGIGDLTYDDGSVNYLLYYKGYDLITNIINYATGAIAVILLTMIPIIVCLELMYINLPFMRGGVNWLASKAHAMEVIMGLCFRHAKLALERSYTSEMGRSPNEEYLRIKTKYVLGAVVIAVLLLGPINDLIKFLINQIYRVVTSVF